MSFCTELGRFCSIRRACAVFNTTFTERRPAKTRTAALRSTLPATPPLPSLPPPVSPVPKPALDDIAAVDASAPGACAAVCSTDGAAVCTTDVAGVDALTAVAAVAASGGIPGWNSPAASKVELAGLAAVGSLALRRLSFCIASHSRLQTPFRDLHHSKRLSSQPARKVGSQHRLAASSCISTSNALTKMRLDGEVQYCRRPIQHRIQTCPHVSMLCSY